MKQEDPMLDNGMRFGYVSDVLGGQKRKPMNT